MSDTADIIRRLIAAGTPPDLIADVADAIAKAEAATKLLIDMQPQRTKRQERNHRYYAARRAEQEEASEKRLNSDAVKTIKTVSDAGTPSEAEKEVAAVLKRLNSDGSDAFKTPPPAPRAEPLPSTLVVPFQEQEPPKENPPSGVKRKGSGKIGTRLPAEFAPDFDIAAAEGFTLPEAEREFERFRDFWIAKPGRDGTKIDWPATWRNWIRRAADERGRGRGPPVPPLPPKTVRNGIFNLAEHLDARFGGELGAAAGGTGADPAGDDRRPEPGAIGSRKHP